MSPLFVIAMFKRETNVYLQVTGGGYYELPVYPDAAFSQVYSEVELPQKTLHNPENLISSGFTSTLNPGNFNFTIALIDTANASAVIECLVQRNPVGHTIYLENDGTVFKLNSCVFSSIVFNLGRNTISTVTMSGTYADSEVDTLPASPLVLGESYTYIQGLAVFIDAGELSNITSLNFEVSNDIQWLPNQTMHDSGPVARENFVTQGKTLSGTVVCNDDMTLPEYNDGVFFGFEITFGGTAQMSVFLPTSIVTRRNQLDDLVKNGYDFRATAEDYTIEYRGVNITQ